MTGKLALSVAIITKDEEENIPALLDSVSFADDIVVVDSGSTDRTVEIAENFCCRVFSEEWRGYGPQKNSAVEKCRNEWVLLLDADERLPAETAKAIAEILKQPAADAYSFRRKNYLHGRWMRHSGYWPDRQVRLVRGKFGSFRGTIHEQWATRGAVADLDAHIDHYAFSGYADMLKTLNEYSTVIAEELHSSGRRAGPLSPVSHGVGMFLTIYFLRLGFLDGLDGLATALTKAGGSFFKYAKLREIQARRPE
ncbi:MAG: glycosyltransferase family 2 protein [Nitrospiraceae bacterium]|nr:glycosyltransferase family 2 protein [Nitrospiraceae bacterium]